jgi:hypothetical protein
MSHSHAVTLSTRGFSVVSPTRALVVEEIGGANGSPGIRALITLVLPNGVTARCQMLESMILQYTGRPLSRHGACGCVPRFVQI